MPTTARRSLTRCPHEGDKPSGPQTERESSPGAARAEGGKEGRCQRGRRERTNRRAKAKDSDRYRFADFRRAQPLCRCSARPARGKVISGSILRTARSLRRRRFAARNGLPAQDLSRVSGQRRRSARRGRFSAVGEPRAEFGPRGPQGPPEAALRVHLSPLRASCRASYAAVSTCRRLTLRARHTKSHSHRAFASPRRLKRRKPSTCLIQP